MGRLIGTTTSYSSLTARNFTTGYSYDAASNRTGFTDPESGSTTYAYDTLNRLQTLTPPSAFSGTGSFGFSYDALSRRTQMTRPNNVATNYAYDNLSRLQSVLHQLAGSTIDGATYTVDNAGNRTAKTDQRTAVTSNYGYDAIYELTGVTRGTNTTESYTYDPVGNRLSSFGVSLYGYNTSNELNSTPTTSYTYDHNGNTTSKSFVLIVNPINDRPTLNPIGNPTLAVNAGPQNISLTGISSGVANENQTLVVQATSSNPVLIPNPTVNYASPNSSGALSFTPAAGAMGSAVITVTVQDDGGTRNGGQNSVTRTFLVTVTPFVPLLSIVSASPDVIVFWSTDAVGFTLQGRDSFSSAWATVTTVPVRVGTQFYVTNSADGNRFYRLVK